MSESFCICRLTLILWIDYYEALTSDTVVHTAIRFVNDKIDADVRIASLNVESASKLIANARKILIENDVLASEFSTADEVLEKRNKLSRYIIGSEGFDRFLVGNSKNTTSRQIHYMQGGLSER